MGRMRASRTAVVVCQGRAAAHGLTAGFADPTALPMLRADERVPVEQVRAGTPPQGAGDRLDYETVRASAEVIVPRTVRIDAAIGARPAPQLVILGAGLDGRAWRLDGLAGIDVFEVDHPASQQEKRDRVGGRAPVARTLRYVSVDLARDPLGDALDAAGHRTSAPTTWVWEGVVPYLTRADVTATVAAVAALSAPGSTLVVNYQTPGVSAALGRLAARTLSGLARRPSPWRDEPRRPGWTPAALHALLTGHGFAVDTDEDLLTIARTLPMPVRQFRSLQNGRVAVATR
jgi:methyltransferase (TIGR00027 family)